MKIVFGLLLFLVSCVATPRYTNTRADVGAKPEHYEQTIREYLRVTLKDPYSVQDFSVSEPELTACSIAPGSPFYGWRVATQYNAKNSYGAYVGLRQYFYWFHGEQVKLITTDLSICPEGW
jgi:hypothetical protein